MIPETIQIDKTSRLPKELKEKIPVDWKKELRDFIGTFIFVFILMFTLTFITIILPLISFS